jgi:hypothetical protein
MKLGEDEISKQMRKDRDRIAWRFSKIYLIFFAVYGVVRIIHWLIDFPSSMSGVNGWAGGIGGAIIFVFAGNFVETFILEYRLRSQSIDQKLIALETRVAAINEPIVMRLAAIADALKIENIQGAGEQEVAKTTEEPESEEALLLKYKGSAERGETWGQHNLGIVYNNGKLVPKDNVQAAYWYRKAADQGDTAAQIYLAHLLAGGEGVEPDYPEAVGLYRLVSEAAHVYSPMAEYYLGEMYVSGKGVARDYVEAARYWTRAAEHGWDLACGELGRLYERGVEGIPQNFSEAYFWFYVSVGNKGDKSVNEYRVVERDQMATHLTPESVRQVQERAQRWLQGERSVSTVG